MQQDNSSPPQDMHSDDISSNLSFDASQASSKFDSSIDANSTLPPDGNDDDSDGSNNQNNNQDEYDDVFAMHSIPHPDELPRTTAKTVERKSGSKAMQTFAGVAGNILEWYDFAVFGFFSDEIGKVFFPPQEGNADIIESFSVFGLAFLMRPIGGTLLGYIGDKYGRKRALEISIFLMAFPTFAMGCLPSYEKVGNLAIVLLVLVRCLQGLSVGGQLVSSLVYTLEQNPKHQWGLYGSYVMAAANFGTLLGGIIATFLRESLSPEDLLSYGWRIPFLSGILVSLCGFYLKFYGEEEIHHHGGESADFDGEEEINPIKMAFRKENRRALISASLVPMLWSGGFYISFVWMATFMDTLIQPPVPYAFLVNSLSLFVSVCLLFPLAGILSDIVGRPKVMYVGGLSLAIFSPVMVYVISQRNPVAAFFAQCTMGISLSLWGAPMCAWLVESFPPAIRLTSVAVGYNIAQAIAGGASPALATYLAGSYSLIAPGFMVSVIAIFSITGLSLLVFGGSPSLVESKPSRERTTSRDNLFNYDDEDDSEDGQNGGRKVSEMELI